jgi:hypothetical protein
MPEVTDTLTHKQKHYRLLVTTRETEIPPTHVDLRAERMDDPRYQCEVHFKFRLDGDGVLFELSQDNPNDNHQTRAYDLFRTCEPLKRWLRRYARQWYCKQVNKSV